MTDRKALVRELAAIRSSGTAFDLEENEVGICAVGGVVEDAAGNQAAITIAAPAATFYARRGEFTAALTRTISEINATIRLPA